MLRQERRYVPVLDTEIAVRLKEIPFWCGDNKLHLHDPNYAQRWCCLNHVIGLPRHPATKKEMPLTPYQVEFFKAIIKEKKRKPGQTKDEAMQAAHKFHVNKGRQMGFTEIVLRIILYFIFHDYAGSRIGIIAATNGSLAKKDLRRMARLLVNIPAVVTQWVKANTMVFVNGCIVEAFPASEEAITGDTNYKCIFMDESAKWKNVDDTPIFNSIVPIVETNGADLFLVSTPKGPIKMFYEIHKDPQDYVKLVYDLWRAAGNLYTKFKVRYMIDHAKEDPNQEYLCKFVLGRNAALGEVTDSMRDENEYEWDYDPEDDSYEEPDDYDEDKDSDSEWRPRPLK